MYWKGWVTVPVYQCRWDVHIYQSAKITLTYKNRKYRCILFAKGPNTNLESWSLYVRNKTSDGGFHCNNKTKVSINSSYICKSWNYRDMSHSNITKQWNLPPVTAASHVVLKLKCMSNEMLFRMLGSKFGMGYLKFLKKDRKKLLKDH